MQPYMAIPLIWLAGAAGLADRGDRLVASLTAARDRLRRGAAPGDPAPAALGLARPRRRGPGARRSTPASSASPAAGWPSTTRSRCAASRWYVFPLGVVAALVGYVAALRRFVARDSVFLLTLSLYAAFFFYKIRIVPEHFWMARRFLPVILPGALLLAAYAAVGRWRDDDRGWQLPDPRRDRRAWSWRRSRRCFWNASSPLRGHVEYAGVIPRLEKLAATFGDRDLVIVESRDASDVHVLALPLAYIYARNVLLLPNRRPDAATMERFLAWARTALRHRLLHRRRRHRAASTKAIAVQPVATEVFQVPEWASARNALPAGDRRKEFDFSIYRFVDPPAAATGAVVARRRRQRRRQRRCASTPRRRTPTAPRSAGRATSRTSTCRASPRPLATLTLVMDDGRRPAAGAAGERRGVAERSGARHGRRSGPTSSPTRWPSRRRWRRPPAPRARRSASSCVTNVWRPKDVLGMPDDRDLGVMVDRVDVR